MKHTPEVPFTDHNFQVEKEYDRCISALKLAGILTPLPESSAFGVCGADGAGYPVPTLPQIKHLFTLNNELVSKKFAQGFDRLELTPMAIPIPALLELLQSALIRLAAAGTVYQTRRSPAEPLIPVRVNAQKHAWMWDVLRQTVDADDLVYFPQKFSIDHNGQNKDATINDEQICAIQGWSVGLVENMPIMPQAGQARTLGSRRQLEIGSSPREYLRLLQTPPFQGETGRTLEDFITRFLTHLVTTGEISNDRFDNNSIWLLGNYVKYVKQLKSDLVPTAWWHHDFGRVRMDAHRPGNKLCTRSWGAATTVRLPAVV